MKSLMGGILLGAGILVAGASGLCSLVFLMMAVSDPGVLPLIMLYGGIPFAFGLGLFFLGRSWIRSARREAQELSSGEQDEGEG